MVYVWKDGDKVKEYMEKLKADGIYEVDDETFAHIQDQFKAGYLNEEEVLKTIKDCYEDNGYVLDTHTACGYGVLKQYQKETGDQTKTILLQQLHHINSLNLFIKHYSMKN